MIALTINGERREVDVPPDMPLLWVLRDVLRNDRDQVRLRHGAVRRVHGAPGRQGDPLLRHAGQCDRSSKRSRRSRRSAPRRNGAKVQKAWLDLEVIQCGYCQSGQIMSATALLDFHSAPERCRHRCGDGRQHLSLRHLCAHSRGHQARCCGGLSAMSDNLSEVTRREFFGLDGGRRVRVRLSCSSRALPANPEEGATFAPNAFIRIDEQGVVTLIIPQVEMGQGMYTSLSMILAEELDADWNRVRVEHAPAEREALRQPDARRSRRRAIPIRSRAFWKPLRQAGATTRACLVEAAARSWKVPAAECRTQDRQGHPRSHRPHARLWRAGRRRRLRSRRRRTCR